MSRTVQTTGDQLANALYSLGINFILGGRKDRQDPHIQPDRLIAALAESDESRLRLSLIPLFLEHPEFAAQVRASAGILDPSARITLQCYYSAAVWFEKMYRTAGSLPDHFSTELNLQPTDDPEENLRTLAQRHEELTGTLVNWLGTYWHAAQIWLKGLEMNRE